MPPDRGGARHPRAFVPVYRDGDADGTPTGGRRQVEYTLSRGEASWISKTRRVSAY